MCWLLMYVFGIYLMFMYVIWFGRKYNSHMMWHKGACLYYVYDTSHMSITVLLLHDLHHDDVRMKQESLLLWLLLGGYGLISPHTLHDDDRGWKQESLQPWLLLGDYGHCTWYDDDVMQ